MQYTLKQNLDQTWHYWTYACQKPVTQHILSDWKDDWLKGFIIQPDTHDSQWPQSNSERQCRWQADIAHDECAHWQEYQK